MHIAYLKDHQDAIPTVAQWLFEQWGHLPPDNTLEKTVATLYENLHDDRIPLTIIAFSGDDVVGTASLIEQDLQTRPDLTPWLASVFVVPEQRGRGIGAALVRAIVDRARTLGVSPLYLFTPDKEAFYRHLGWQTVETTNYRGEDVVIMQIVP
ncbi:GNAT family N-acetyltransferase [candidate division KSB3 bacterium]|nr:GNAT family N-acetyltransferase [candidate division KSB3 bacterium]